MSKLMLEKRVVKLVPCDVSRSEVLSLSDGAKRLGLSATAVSDLILRGVLTRLVDPDEPNSRKAGRVLRVEIESELSRRRRNGGDRRFRGRVCVA